MLAGSSAAAVVQSLARSALEAKNLQLAAAQEATNRALDEATTARGLTQAALAQSEAARGQAKAINDFLTEDLLKQADPAHGEAEDHVSLLEVLDRAAGKVGERFSGRPGVEDAVRRTIARTYHGLGSWEKAEAQWRSVLESARRRLGGESLEALTALGELAHILTDRGRRDPEVIEMASSAAEGLTRILGPDDPETLRSRNDLARGLPRRRGTAEAMALHESTLKSRESKLGPDHPDTLTSRNNLAEVYRIAGRIAEAIPLHEATLRQRETRLGPGHPTRSTAATTSPGLPRRRASRRGHPAAQGEPQAVRVEARPGPPRHARHPQEPRRGLSRRRPYRRGHPAARGDPQLQESKLGADHPVTLTSRNNLAAIYLDAGRTAEALALHEANLKPYESKLGHDHPDTLTSRNNLAAAYRAAGRTPRPSRCTSRP